ncbi:tRNA pseudouridine(55) synthase TruB [Parafannyhessea sp. LCP21S3_E6]|uniref:tRNA pseudouridine(55) synthase TruB n=1 Tax=unclassified Parafannyhessea TaxID=2847323 RepID=UPI003F99595C
MKRGQSGINCLLAIDKPVGLSSHDVVNHVRRALGEKRVGHAGTLDPLASGVLVVGVGQGTRLMGLLTADTKSYVARIAFGTQTATDDAEGEVVLRRDAPADVLSREFAAGVVAGLEGEQDQVPPSFSAISVGGVRAYERARKGQEVELKSRHVTIMSAVLLDVVAEGPDGQPCWDCAFTVSKGTYVRSIARDLGASLGSAAHLVELRRTASGGIGLADCIALEELERRGAAALAECALDPVRKLGLPARELTVDELADVRCGKRVTCTDAGLPEGGRVCLTFGDALVGIWEREGERLRCQINFPSGVTGVAR